ncbi:dynamin family protein [Methyloprofundus sp.]|uniref:dynamin family protein n=1 Tax=Methyloprofundus sp. TaxID=2020875 RepID=UPI003D0F187E
MSVMDKTHALKDNLLAVKARKIRTVLDGKHPEIDFLLDRINHTITQPITVAIMGEFSAGKSSFLNRLLGIDALPVSVLPKTATLTRLVYGTEAAVEIDYDFDGKLISKHHSGYEIFSELQRAAKVNDPVFLQELERIREVRVFVNNIILTKLHLLDTPGFNHDQSMDDKSISALANADIVIWIGDYNQLAKKTEFEKLATIQQRIKRLYLIINKADVHISDSAAYLSAKEELTSNLADNAFLNFFQNEDIHLISSQATDPFWDGKFQQFVAHFSQVILNADLKLSLSLIEEQAESLKQLLKDESNRYTQLQHRLVTFEAQNNVDFLIARDRNELFFRIGDAASELCISLGSYCQKCAGLNTKIIFSANSFVADYLIKDLYDQFLALQKDYGNFLNEWQNRYREELLIVLEQIIAFLPSNHQSLIDRVNTLIAYYRLDDTDNDDSCLHYLPATDRTIEILRLMGIKHFDSNPSGSSAPITFKLELNVLNDGILNLNSPSKKILFSQYIANNISESILESYQSDISHIISNRIVKGIVAELNSISADAIKQLDTATQIMTE